MKKIFDSAIKASNLGAWTVLGSRVHVRGFYAWLLLNQFCILAFSLSGVFCSFLILPKFSLCFAALGNMTVIFITDAYLKQMVLTYGGQLVKITLQ